jgi:hypothetical protein
MNRRPAQIGPREKYLVVIPGIVPHGGYFYVSNEDMADYLDTVKSDSGRVDGTAVVLPTAAYPNPSSTGPGTATLLRDIGRKIVLANPDGAHRTIYTQVQEVLTGSPGSTTDYNTYWVPTYSASDSLATPFARAG